MKKHTDHHTRFLWLGAAACAALAILGVALILLHASAFWVGVGLCLALGASQASWNCARAARGAESRPERVAPARTQTLREWWTTPKRYPSGDGFTPRESALYGGMCVLGIVACLGLAGLAAMLVANGFSHR